MGDRGISTHAVTYMFSHPLWTPEGVDGTAVSGASADDPQAFDAAGVMLKLSGGLGLKEVIEDRTGDGNDGMVQEPSGFETADDISVTYTVPNAGPGAYLPGYLHTVKTDPMKRPGTLVITWVTGDTTTITFHVEHNMPIPVAGGALTGAANLKHETPPVEVRA